jgi:CBS domain-containing protein
MRPRNTVDTLVSETMTPDVVTIRQDRDVHELEELMLDKKVHGVPVVDETGRLVGVVSQTDVLAWHFEAGIDGASFYGDAELLPGKAEPRDMKLSDGRTAKVKDIMSPLVYCITDDRPVVEAAAMMIQRWIHRLVVVDDDLHVRGVVSAIDLLHCLPGASEALRRATAANS